jgi:hypothetical protein
MTINGVLRSRAVRRAAFLATTGSGLASRTGRRLSLLSLGLLVAGGLALDRPRDARAADAPSVASPGAAHELSVRRGLVTARLDRVPLVEVLAELARQIGAAVAWPNGPRLELVATTFTDVPLREALQRLLDRNYLLTEGAGESSVRRIAVFGGTGTAAPAATADPPAPPPDGESAAPELDVVAQRALGDPDQTARLEAVEKLEFRAHADDVAHSLLDALARGDADTVVQAAATSALRRLRRRDRRVDPRHPYPF